MEHVTMCGKPYAVVIAETPEEAEKLYEFMHSIRNETSNHKPEPEHNEWYIEDEDGITEECNSYEEAYQIARSWCYDAATDGFTVTIYNNDEYYDEVSCEIIVN